MEKQSDSALFEAFGIGFSQFKILMALGFHQYVQQKEIAQFLGQTEASISRQIKLLAEAELIDIGSQADDRKKHIISLTQKGRQLTDDSFVLLNSRYEPIMSAVSSADQKMILDKLSPILDQLEMLCEKRTN